MKVTLNLATRPFGAGRAFWLGAGATALVVLAVTLWVGVQGWQAWQQGANPRVREAELRARVAELERKQQNYEARLRAPEAKQVLDRASFYNRLLERKTVSWAELFVALEKHLPNQVRILELAPELREDGAVQLELRVGAESVATLVQFLESLEGGEAFSDVAVRSQQRGERGPDRIVAEVSANYRARG